MANRDVDLVIRARNEASKAVETITTALEKLVGKTDEVKVSGKETDSVLQSLKSRFNELGREAAAVQNLDKITAAMDRANNSVKRLSDNVAKQENELGDLRTRTQVLTSVEEQLRARATAAAAAVDSQKTSIRNLKTEATAAATEIRKLESQLQTLDRSRAPTTQVRASTAALSTDRQGRNANLRNDLPGSTARDAAQTLLSGELSAQKTRHALLLSQIGAEESALKREADTVTTLNSSLRANGAEQRNLAGQIETVSTSLERNVRNLGQAKDALDEIREASLSASEALSKVSGRQNVVAQGALTVAGAQATANTSRLDSDKLIRRQSQDQAIASARQSLEKARTELLEQQASTTPQVSYVDRLKNAAVEVKGQIDASKASMQGLKSEVKETASSIKQAENALAKIERAIARPRAKSKSEEVYNAEQLERNNQAEILRQQLDTLRTQLGPQQQLLSDEQARVTAGKAVADQIKAQAKAAKELSQAQARVDSTTGLIGRVEAVMSRPRARTLSEADHAQKQSERAEAVAAFQAQLIGEQSRLDAAMRNHAAVAQQTGAVAVQSLSREEKVIRDLERALEEAAKDASSLSAELESVAVAQQRAVRNNARIAAEQATVKARIDGLSAKQDPLLVAEGSVALNRQKLEARRTFTNQEQEVRNLARAMREAEQPTEEMGRVLGEAQARARLAKQEYQALAEAAHRLKNAQGSFNQFSAGQPTTTRAYVSGSNVRGLGSSPTAGASASANLPPIAPQETRATGQAMQEAAGSTNAFRDALRGVYGDTRESLSLMQRLRGEVLALGASYIGLQAAISGVRYVIDVFRTLEAAQSRLGAVFQQDTARVSQEIDYLRRNANRLGIEFGTLSDEYGKFSIASQAANVSAKDTRSIFMSVAEAARVNKLSNDQVKGVFLALSQMMSKGSVQSEELKRQLGDRLPGAMNIMAAALGVTTKKLEEMMMAGEVLANSDTMLAFANELNKRFGPQLAAALATTTTEIGKFQNNLQSAALQAANGGLIEGFTNLLKTLNDYLQSDSGRDFFMSLGAGARSFFNAIATLVPYLGTLKTIFGAILALKFSQMLIGIGTALRANVTDSLNAARATDNLSGAQARLVGFSAAVSRELTVMQAAMTMTAISSGRAAVGANIMAAGLGVLRTAVTGVIAGARALLAVFGGLAGIVVTGLTIAATSWFTAVDDTTSSIEKHKTIIDKIVTSYEAAKNKTGDWANKIKDVSKAQVAVEIGNAAQNTRTAMASVRAPSRTRMVGRDEAEVVQQNSQLTALVEQFRAGRVTIEQFKKDITAIGDADPGLDNRVIAQIIKFAEKADDAKKVEEQLRAGLAQMNGTATESQKKMLSLNEALEDAPFKEVAKDAQAFEQAINELKSGIPQLVVELKRLKEEGDALKNLEAAVKAAGTDANAIREAYGAYDAKTKSINDEETRGYIKQFGGDRIPLSMIEEIFGREGYRSQAYQDVGGKPTIGFGSTSVNGKPVQMGDAISKADAVRQMVADLSKFVAMVDSATGNAKLTENQRNALTSYVYNVGNTDGSAGTRAIFEAIREGRPDAEVARLLGEGGVATVNGQPNAALRTRRRQEAALYLRSDDRAAGQDSGATSYDRDKATVDTRRDIAEEVRKQVERDTRAASDQKRINDAPDQTTTKREIAIQTALIEAQNRAKEKGGELTAKEAADIKASSAARYDQEHINDRALEAEEKVNSLYKLRQQLLEELKVAQEQGDGTQLAATRDSIEEVNKKLQEAIPLAIQYWQAIGGTEADTAIAKLRLMDAQTQRNKTQIVTAQQVNEKFASGAVNAFDNVADGIGRAIAGTGSWKDALAGAGQAFMQFAADFLREIANMILKQIVLNALQSSMGMGGGGGGFGGIIASAMNAAVAHTGGVVGSNTVGKNGTRMVDPSWFINAQRYHNGGIAGLKPGELPTILQKNEEVITQNDPRHAMNGGKGGARDTAGGVGSLKVVAVFDPNEIPAAMQTSSGERATLATLKKNRESVKQMLGMK